VCNQTRLQLWRLIRSGQKEIGLGLRLKGSIVERPGLLSLTSRLIDDAERGASQSSLNRYVIFPKTWSHTNPSSLSLQFCRQVTFLFQRATQSGKNGARAPSSWPGSCSLAAALAWVAQHSSAASIAFHSGEVMRLSIGRLSIQVACAVHRGQ
jgi:hypothetical protein